MEIFITARGVNLAYSYLTLNNIQRVYEECDILINIHR